MNLTKEEKDEIIKALKLALNISLETENTNYYDYQLIMKILSKMVSPPKGVKGIDLTKDEYKKFIEQYKDDNFENLSNGGSGGCRSQKKKEK